jgi:hypothetical protein
MEILDRVQQEMLDRFLTKYPELKGKASMDSDNYISLDIPKKQEALWSARLNSFFSEEVSKSVGDL